MAIGGLSGATSSSINSLRGYGGLASGLDRDSLIESMTAGTTAKINRQMQSKQKLTWEQEAIRNITEQMYQLSQKYMSFSSPDNLISSSLFVPNKITALGEFSKFVSVTGGASAADTVTILGVKQMAQNATASSKGAVSNQNLSTGYLGYDLTADKTLNTMGGSSLALKWGNKTVTVRLPEDPADLAEEGSDEEYSYDTIEDVVKAFNKACEDVSIGTDKKLSDVLEASVKDGKMVLKNKDTAGNNIQIIGHSNNMLEKVGLLEEGQKITDLEEEDLKVTSDGLEFKNDPKLTETKSKAEWLAEKEISVTYNGKTAKIKLPKEDEIKNLKQLKEFLQESFDKEFGKGRILVEGGGTGKLTFKTTTPDGSPDTSSVLTFNSSGFGVLGKEGVFGIEKGGSNRLNMTSSVIDSGLKNMAGATIGGKPVKKNTELDLTINGVKIDGLTYGDSISTIMKKINENPDVGVRVSYSEHSDKFTFTSTQEGASGEIKLEGESAKHLFGTENDANGYVVTKGQDAVLSVKFEGSEEPVEITRGSNTFDLNGMNITIKGEFGYKDGTIDETSEPVTFEASMDIDKTVEAVKGMIESLNKIIELVNKEAGTKPNRDYPPLTSEQEAEMSENQIEQWNEKAKEGLLFNDTALRGLSDSLRFLASNNPELWNIGIKPSSDYGDKGKLEFDETKFREALEKDPEAVRKAFTAPRTTDEETGKNIAGGLMTEMKMVFDKYAAMTGAEKGILVERAGSVHAPTSIMDNGLQKEIDSIDGTIKKLQNTLQTEQARYISQFTSLEMMISQMNAQSSWLNSAFGY